MKNSRLIERPAAYEILGGFIHDPANRRQSAPARIARALESEAIDGGWRGSGLIGSERDLIARFGVGREVMREAIRVVEVRGLMRMRRGCKGGLHLVRPHLDQAAGVVATYLRSCGCSHAELAETRSVVEPILDQLPGDNLLVRLFRRTIGLLAGDDTDDAEDTKDAEDDRDTIRGIALAMRLIQEGGPVPEDGTILGSEGELCAKHRCGRSTLRQALRVLDDLGMLQVRRGRGGGYGLQRPSPIGVIRHLFALLASRQQELSDVVQMTWALNVAALRLTMRHLDHMPAAERSARCDALLARFAGVEEPHRWMLLHEFLRDSASSRLVDILLLSLMAYQARRDPVTFSSRDEALLAGEKAIVEAMRISDAGEAERQIHHCHALISQLLGVTDVGPI